LGCETDYITILRILSFKCSEYDYTWDIHWTIQFLLWNKSLLWILHWYQTCLCVHHFLMTAGCFKLRNQNRIQDNFKLLEYSLFRRILMFWQLNRFSQLLPRKTNKVFTPGFSLGENFWDYTTSQQETL